MKLVDVLEVPNAGGIRRIELLQGDLAALPPEHAVDVLVVSAFPGDYTPTATSLIGALDRRELSIAVLAKDPEADLRRNFSCWLSRPIGPLAQKLNFERVLCFEPAERGTPPEVVGDIFQALAPFAFAPPHIRSVAMPIVAVGDQGYAVEDVLPPLLDAAWNWLHRGFPIETIKLVVRDEEALGRTRALFARQRAVLNKTRPLDRLKGMVAGVLGLPDRFTFANKATQPVYAYDVFISYSRQNEAAARHLAERLETAGLRVFIDRKAIDIGATWLQTINEALDDCSIIAALYSPSFVASKVCKRELNIALMRGLKLDRDLVFPLLIEDTELPTYMAALNYVDCRISDKPKIEAAAEKLAETLRAAA